MIWVVWNNRFARNKRLLFTRKICFKQPKNCWLLIPSIGKTRTQHAGGQQTSALLLFRFFAPCIGTCWSCTALLARNSFHSSSWSPPVILTKTTKMSSQTEEWMAHHNSSQFWVLMDWWIPKAGGWSAMYPLGQIQKNGLLCFASATSGGSSDVCAWRMDVKGEFCLSSCNQTWLAGKYT